MRHYKIVLDKDFTTRPTNIRIPKGTSLTYVSRTRKDVMIVGKKGNYAKIPNHYITKASLNALPQYTKRK